MAKCIMLQPDQDQQNLLTSDGHILSMLHNMLNRVEVEQTRIGRPYGALELMSIVNQWKISNEMIRSLDDVSLHFVAKSVGNAFTRNPYYQGAEFLPGKIFPIAISIPTIAILPGYITFKRYGTMPVKFPKSFTGKITRATITKLHDWILELTVTPPMTIPMPPMATSVIPNYGYENIDETRLPEINDYEVQNSLPDPYRSQYFGPNDRLEIWP